MVYGQKALTMRRTGGFTPNGTVEDPEAGDDVRSIDEAEDASMKMGKLALQWASSWEALRCVGFRVALCSWRRGCR